MKTLPKLFVSSVTLALQWVALNVSLITAQDNWQDPPVGSVRLTPSSPIAQGLAVNRKVLDAIGVDRALLAFRIQAKLPTNDAKPLGGWAGPEPYGPFPGFFESHFLSAISIQSVNDPTLLPLVHRMIEGLAQCQRELGGKYLFASPEVEFNADRLDGVAWYRMQWLAAKEDLEAKIAYRYRIDSSLNKTTWEPIADGSENREFREVYEHTISKRLARYIRFQQWGTQNPL
jgi:hypothetical protein